ncbi:MAG: hypothetical protein ACE1ZS_00745 [Candidatus Poribacteria bacterium]
MEHKGDFLNLLKAQGAQIQFDLSEVQANTHTPRLEMAEGTTVIAMRYKDGVLIAGDRRATMGTSILYDRADKVLPIDE